MALNERSGDSAQRDVTGDKAVGNLALVAIFLRGFEFI